MFGTSGSPSQKSTIFVVLHLGFLPRCILVPSYVLSITSIGVTDKGRVWTLPAKLGFVARLRRRLPCMAITMWNSSPKTIMYGVLIMFDSEIVARIRSFPAVACSHPACFGSLCDSFVEQLTPVLYHLASWDHLVIRWRCYSTGPSCHVWLGIRHPLPTFR